MQKIFTTAPKMAQGFADASEGLGYKDLLKLFALAVFVIGFYPAVLTAVFGGGMLYVTLLVYHLIHQNWWYLGLTLIAGALTCWLLWKPAQPKGEAS